MNRLRGAVADATSVVVHGLKLLWGHWPILLTIFLFGAAGRAAALWGAMQLTKVNNLAGSLLVPLAPLATVAALILALRALSPALKWANFQGAPEAAADGEGEDPGPRRGFSFVEDRLALLASTLIPFFAVYAAQGYLKEDTRQFLNETSADEARNNSDFWLGTGSLDFERVQIATGWWFWGSVAVAFGLRWLIDKLELPKRNIGWGWLAAYVEVAWVTLFATALMTKFNDGIDWLKNRQAAVSTQTAYENATAALGGPGEVINSVLGYIGSLIGRADAIIIIPMAWLTVGAVVYGRSLSQIKTDQPSERAQRWSARAEKVPGPIRRVGSEIFSGPIDRFKGLSNAIGTFARVGLAAMLLFCLVFVLAKWAEVGVAWVLAQLIGAQEASLMEVISPYTDLIRRAVYTVLIVSLLAAAVDRILKPSPEDPAQPEELATAPATSQ